MLILSVSCVNLPISNQATYTCNSNILSASNDDEEEEEDTCSVTQMWRAAACAANLNNYINESLQHMNNGDLDIFTFCE